MSQRPSLAAIFTVFFRIGMLSFGGGLTGWVYREVVVMRTWIAEDEFLSGLAMCQVLPGGNVINFSIYLGQKLRGVLGSCAALIGLISGPFFFVIGLASGYGLLKTYPFIEPAMEGIAASAIGLVLIVAIRGTRVAASQPVPLIAMLATFVGVGIMQWSLPIVAAVVGTLSVLAAWVRQNR